MIAALIAFFMTIGVYNPIARFFDIGGLSYFLGLFIAFFISCFILGILVGLVEDKHPWVPWLLFLGSDSDKPAKRKSTWLEKSSAIARRQDEERKKRDHELLDPEQRFSGFRSEWPD